MDSMDLEREKGITIQSAATHCQWNDTRINIIDTPGHVDFTIEVERALRVLDGAIMVLCGVSGVQSQTLTVDRQMKRYNVPRLAFLNKLDRMGARPYEIVEQIKKKLGLESALVQLPIGLEDKLCGVVDLITRKAHYFEGSHGQFIRTDVIPIDMKSIVEERRETLITTLSNVNDRICDLVLDEMEPTTEAIYSAIREATIERRFVPVFLGSAYKNVGVQTLLDGVSRYLPNPGELQNTYYKNEEQKTLLCDSERSLIAYAFKLEDGRYGQLTYIRVYQGRLSRGMTIANSRTGKRLKVPRVVRMHSSETEDVESIESGEICAVFGIDCSTGDTFTSEDPDVVGSSMSSMYVPEPVVSLAIQPKSKDNSNFSKALTKFQKEDPTFRVHFDPDTKETIISGMGELHLEIYIERMKREYSCEVITGSPQVNYKVE